MIASPVRAHVVLGWKAQIADLDEIVRHALAWEMKLKTQGLYPDISLKLKDEREA